MPKRKFYKHGETVTRSKQIKFKSSSEDIIEKCEQFSKFVESSELFNLFNLSHMDRPLEWLIDNISSIGNKDKCYIINTISNLKLISTQKRECISYIMNIKSDIKNKNSKNDKNNRNNKNNKNNNSKCIDDKDYKNAGDKDNNENYKNAGDNDNKNNNENNKNINDDFSSLSTHSLYICALNCGESILCTLLKYKLNLNSLINEEHKWYKYTCMREISLLTKLAFNSKWIYSPANFYWLIIDGVDVCLYCKCKCKTKCSISRFYNDKCNTLFDLLAFYLKHYKCDEDYVVTIGDILGSCKKAVKRMREEVLSHLNFSPSIATLGPDLCDIIFVYLDWPKI